MHGDVLAEIQPTCVLRQVGKVRNVANWYCINQLSQDLKSPKPPSAKLRARIPAPTRKVVELGMWSRPKATEILNPETLNPKIPNRDAKKN